METLGGLSPGPVSLLCGHRGLCVGSARKLHKDWASHKGSRKAFAFCSNPCQDPGATLALNNSTCSEFHMDLSSEYSRLLSFRMDWLDLLAVQGTLKTSSPKASLLRRSAFFTDQLSHLHVTTGGLYCSLSNLHQDTLKAQEQCPQQTHPKSAGFGSTSQKKPPAMQET